MTRQEIQELWLYASEKWSNFTIPHDAALRTIKMQAWVDELGDLDQRHVRSAMVSLGANQFLPALGLLRQEALELARLEQGIRRCPEIDQAWAEVMSAIRRGGLRSKPEFSHPAVTEAVAAMGWPSLCRSENVDVIRGQFSRIYDAARSRVMRDISPPPPALAPFREAAIAAITSGRGIAASPRDNE